MQSYAAAYPAVVQRQGLEISKFNPHINWFGGPVVLGDYTGVTSGSSYMSYARQQVGYIHSVGGVASYNHPFGNGGSLLSVPAQDAKVSQVAATLLANNLLDTDIIEVGYPVRGGCDLAHHVALWDVLSRNGRFVTGNGTTDDHFGQNWLGLKNNWFTSVWAASTAESDLVDALRSGRVWSASLSRFRGTLDLVADGGCPMGSVSVSGVSQRLLQVVATKVPSGGSVRVVRGVCDYTGTTPNTATVASYSASEMAGGSVSMTVDTNRSCFVRTEVLNSTGVVVALSNPIWLLREQPPGGIPLAQAC
jgi:hypothetical protein